MLGLKKHSHAPLSPERAELSAESSFRNPDSVAPIERHRRGVLQDSVNRLITAYEAANEPVHFPVDENAIAVAELNELHERQAAETEAAMARQAALHAHSQIEAARLHVVGDDNLGVEDDAVTPEPVAEQMPSPEQQDQAAYIEFLADQQQEAA